jgi:hypothetical protein
MKTLANSAVIDFPQARVRPAATREPGTGSADVVIFSGVRIERLPDEPEAIAKAPGNVTRKRSRQRR